MSLPHSFVLKLASEEPSQHSSYSNQLKTLYGLEPHIVLDIGSHYLKAGFSGESFPRCTVEYDERSFLGYRCTLAENITRFPVDFEYLLWDEPNLELIGDRLEIYLREVYNKWLNIGSKFRKVSIVEYILLPIKFKVIIAKTLFTYFQVPSITFLSSHVLVLVSLGLNSGIVIDIGSKETSVIPIYDLRPMTSFIVTSSLASNFCFSRLKYLLTHYSIPRLASLTFYDVQDFLQRAVFCLPISPLASSKSTIILLEDLENTYKSNVECSDVIWEPPSQKGLEVTVPGWVRVCITEALFEGSDKYADTDEISIPQMIKKCLSHLPIDIRSKVSTSLVISGGFSLIPGLQNRINNEIKASGKVIRNEFGVNAAWVGASLLGDLKIEGLYEITRENFIKKMMVPDWSISFKDEPHASNV
ncbi:hypothetical protein T552_03535 [Pneumocystis carinii B80]|uniref:Uncharacterized protein n=1 Tax=Pneumocystis carinii (strain B80) TaxID=1408658 RepID=A0A0W4ZB67_PNEC8|nr:hypothetical protein T552_03535 [Pneumocystis carinii B80]KTW25674.1 hypothetical protein T552_03535 [Pneumocystis carinii B80]